MIDRTNQVGMDLVAKSVVGWLKGFILLFGVYLVLHSHKTPGGGFAGGVIIACAFILVTLVEGQHCGQRLLGKNLASKLAGAGALLFLVNVMAHNCRMGAVIHHCPAAGHAGFLSFLAVHAIPIYDIALALVVSMLIYLVFSIMAAVHVAVRDGQRKMIRKRR